MQPDGIAINLTDKASHFAYFGDNILNVLRDEFLRDKFK